MVLLPPLLLLLLLVSNASVVTAVAVAVPPIKESNHHQQHNGRQQKVTGSRDDTDDSMMTSEEKLRILEDKLRQMESLLKVLVPVDELQQQMTNSRTAGSSSSNAPSNKPSSIVFPIVPQQPLRFKAHVINESRTFELDRTIMSDISSSMTRQQEQQSTAARADEPAPAAAASIAIDSDITSGSSSSSDGDGDDSESWAKLQISPDSIGSMSHGTLVINIYKSAPPTATKNTQSLSSSSRNAAVKFYFAPMTLLDHRSARSIKNSKQLGEMNFRVEMWNDDVQTKVYQWIKMNHNNQVNKNFVQVLPFNQVSLTTTSESFRRRYQLPSWMPYGKQKEVRFKIVCLTTEDCDELAENMQTNPFDFTDFVLNFKLDSSKLQTKQLTMRSDSFMSGSMGSKLEQQMEDDFALLTAKDEQLLLRELAANIMADSFDDDSDIASPNTQTEVLNFLKTNIFDSPAAPGGGKVTLKDGSDEMWNSLLWTDEDSYRPDLIARAFTDVFYTFLDRDLQERLIQSFKDTRKIAKGVAAGIPGVVEAKAELQTEFAPSGNIKTITVDKLWLDFKETVLWDGQKFVPKPLTVSRVNLAKLRDGTMEQRSLRVRYSKAAFSTAINVVDSATADSLFGADLAASFAAQKRSPLTARTEALDQLMPSNCNDLKALGNSVNGFYTVKSTTGNKLMTIFCNFVKNLETVIGYNDVKTTSGVSFFVQRSTTFSTVGTAIPYDTEKLNIGGGMNMATGVFTAPTNGRYFFSFIGTSFTLNDVNWVYLRLNGNVVTVTLASSRSYSLPLSTTLNMKTGDTLDVVLGGGSIADDANHFTQFSGVLLEEDLNLNALTI